MKPFFAFESSIPGYKIVGEQLKMNFDTCPTGHLIIYFFVKLQVSCDTVVLKTNTGEVEACVWVGNDDMSEVLNRNHEVASKKISGFDCELQPREFKLEEFFPYYPNSLNAGIGKASTFALKFLLMKESLETARLEDANVIKAKL